MAAAAARGNRSRAAASPARRVSRRRWGIARFPGSRLSTRRKSPRAGWHSGRRRSGRRNDRARSWCPEKRGRDRSSSPICGWNSQASKLRPSGARQAKPLRKPASSSRPFGRVAYMPATLGSASQARGMPDAAEAAFAGGDLRFEYGRARFAEQQIDVADDAGADRGLDRSRRWRSSPRRHWRIRLRRPGATLQARRRDTSSGNRR